MIILVQSEASIRSRDHSCPIRSQSLWDESLVRIRAICRPLKISEIMMFELQLSSSKGIIRGDKVTTWFLRTGNYKYKLALLWLACCSVVSLSLADQLQVSAGWISQTIMISKQIANKFHNDLRNECRIICHKSRDIRDDKRWRCNR